MGTRIANVIRYVADQDRSVAFWTGTIGFTVRTDVEMWPGARWVEVGPTVGETGIVLLAVNDFADEVVSKPAGFTLVTDDLVAAHAALVANGVEVGAPVTEAFGTFITFTDPDGYDYVLSQVSDVGPFAATPDP